MWSKTSWFLSSSPAEGNSGNSNAAVQLRTIGDDDLAENMQENPMNAQQPNVQEATLETLSSDAASFCDKQTAMELHFDDDPSDEEEARREDAAEEETTEGGKADMDAEKEDDEKEEKLVEKSPRPLERRSIRNDEEEKYPDPETRVKIKSLAERDLRKKACRWNVSVSAPDGCAYCIPGYASRVLRIDSSKNEVEAIGPDLGKGNKYKAAILVAKNDGGEEQDACIYGIPYDAERILKITTGKDCKVELVGPSYTELEEELEAELKRPLKDFEKCRSGRWETAAWDEDSKNIFAIPCNHSHVLRIHVFGNKFTGRRTWSVDDNPRTRTDVEACLVGKSLGILPKKYRSCVYAAGSRCIYGIPFNASKLLRIDLGATTSSVGQTNTGLVRVVSDRHLRQRKEDSDEELSKVKSFHVAQVGDEIRGKHKWTMAVIDENSGSNPGSDARDGRPNTFYTIPYSAKVVMRIVSVRTEYGVYEIASTLKLDSADSSLATGGLWADGIYSAFDGRIYCVPKNASKVLCIDTLSIRDDKVVYSIGPYLGEEKNKFSSAIQLRSDGCIYGVPATASKVLWIIPMSMKVTEIGRDLKAPDNGGSKYSHAVVCGREDFCFYLIPADGSSSIIRYESHVKFMERWIRAAPGKKYTLDDVKKFAGSEGILSDLCTLLHHKFATSTMPEFRRDLSRSRSSGEIKFKSSDAATPPIERTRSLAKLGKPYLVAISGEEVVDKWLKRVLHVDEEYTILDVLLFEWGSKKKNEIKSTEAHIWLLVRHILTVVELIPDRLSRLHRSLLKIGDDGIDAPSSDSYLQSAAAILDDEKKREVQDDEELDSDPIRHQLERKSTMFSSASTDSDSSRGSTLTNRGRSSSNTSNVHAEIFKQRESDLRKKRNSILRRAISNLDHFKDRGEFSDVNPRLRALISMLLLAQKDVDKLSEHAFEFFNTELQYFAIDIVNTVEGFSRAQKQKLNNEANEERALVSASMFMRFIKPNASHDVWYAILRYQAFARLFLDEIHFDDLHKVNCTDRLITSELFELDPVNNTIIMSNGTIGCVEWLLEFVDELKDEEWERRIHAGEGGHSHRRLKAIITQILEQDDNHTRSLLYDNELLKTILTNKRAMLTWMQYLLSDKVEDNWFHISEYFENISRIAPEESFESEDDFSLQEEEEESTSNATLQIKHKGDLMTLSRALARMEKPNFIKKLLQCNSYAIKERINGTKLMKMLLEDKFKQPLAVIALAIDGLAIVTLIPMFLVVLYRVILDFGEEWYWHSEKGSIFSHEIGFVLGCVLYFFLREIAQVVAMVELKMLRIYISDAWNWVDLSLIALVSWIMHYIITRGDVHRANFRVISALTSGIIWLKFLGFIRIVYFKFAIFMRAIQQIFREILPFCIVLFVVMGLFAEMLVLIFDGREGNIAFEAVDNTAWTSWGETGLTAYRMLFGDFDRDWFRTKRGNGAINRFAVILFVCFQFLVGIVLLNILIAVVSDSYEYCMEQGEFNHAQVRLNIAAEFESLGLSEASDLNKRIRKFARGSILGQKWLAYRQKQKFRQRQKIDTDRKIAKNKRKLDPNNQMLDQHIQKLEVLLHKDRAEIVKVRAELAELEQKVETMNKTVKSSQAELEQKMETMSRTVKSSQAELEQKVETMNKTIETISETMTLETMATVAERNALEQKIDAMSGVLNSVHAAIQGRGV